jgi:transglutaminase-like putative cysteine protease
MKHFLMTTLLALACSCAPQTKPVSMEQIEAAEAAGHFTQAGKLIDRFIAENDLTESEVYQLNVRKDILHRIRIDFNKDKAAVEDYIRKYYPDVNDEMLARWEAAKTLESMTIDGEKRYFDRSAPNLFRLDREAMARREAVAPITDKKDSILQIHLPEVVNTLTQSGKTQAAPVKMTVKYELTLRPNVVPEGEIVRCWLPFPREDNRRQSNVKLLSVSQNDYIIAPISAPHRTLYMEQTACKDEPMKFAFSFSYQHAPEWFHLEGLSIPAYDTESELYRTYTAERPPHIVFTDSIRAVSERVLAGETDPYQKAKRLWEWVDTTFPWAGAREYSTIPNIPQYVLENGHGDCGQVTLLFMTLARYNGIPTRWQSGFMMHPGSLNLHDWSEFYIEGLGWIPMDESFGLTSFSENEAVKYFYSNGIDAYRWIVNSDYSQPLFPAKTYLRSDDVDFQRGELEWRGGNIYYDQWKWDFDVSYE